MKTVSKKKVQDIPALVATRGAGKKLAIPTLLDRVTAICQEASDAIDAACEQTKKNAPGVPLPMIRQMVLSRAGLGQCVCQAYRQLVKNGSV
jgi:hypothetical protein